MAHAARRKAFAGIAVSLIRTAWMLSDQLTGPGQYTEVRSRGLQIAYAAIVSRSSPCSKQSFSISLFLSWFRQVGSLELQKQSCEIRRSFLICQHIPLASNNAQCP
jgi:hypothetical protein